MLIRKDPLLGILRAIIWFAIGVLCFAAFVLFVGAPIIALAHDTVLLEMAKEGKEVGTEFIAALCVLLLGIGALLVGIVYFFWNLLAITDTVRDGDPFIPENATRLTRMGWLAIAANVWGAMLAIPGAWVAGMVGDVDNPMEFEGGFDGTGLILILVLFVLARVFRHGAEMREDLEGTV